MPQDNLPTLTVEGVIYDAFNEPLTNVKVKAFDKDLRKAHLVGEAVTDKKGHYLIRYNSSKFSWAEKESADLFLLVFKNAPRDKKEIGKSSIHFNVPLKYVLDFKIDDTEYIGLPEFDTLVNTIQPLLAGQRVKIVRPLLVRTLRS